MLKNPGASLSEVAKFAGVGRATLYRHFATRDALILAVFIDSLEVLAAEIAALEATGQRGREAIVALVAALLPKAEHFRFVGVHWDELAPKVLSAQELAERDKEMVQFIVEAQAEGVLRPDLPPEWIGSTVDALLFTAWELRAGGKVTDEQALQIVLTTLFEGVGPR
ncbi:TetR/AcrR family transcriptional regulator [Pseudovibrio exalbescens]|uniref:TetR/AcrR family transcriptional regulator n=1 Tax=Pseudovibrio exalbescens TaxID=197461 RepID=UPI0023663687|nr:TetR/AcrR family transcriptional regulator [Pseudovibrio exalbescens]MDD7910830.1 TetR/AcrR family transcriptional regulator [Pseudovibrio exalbescens]